eukprot:1192014-Prorocentrum_minimum.AAC.2
MFTTGPVRTRMSSLNVVRSSSICPSSCDMMMRSVAVVRSRVGSSDRRQDVTCSEETMLRIYLRIWQLDINKI